MSPLAFSPDPIRIDIKGTTAVHGAPLSPPGEQLSLWAYLGQATAQRWEQM